MGDINGSVNNFLENLCLWFVNERIFVYEFMFAA